MTEETPTHIEATAKIVASIAGQYSIDQIAGLIPQVRRALLEELAPIAPPSPPKADPVVTAKKSVRDDAVTCMTCGQVGQSLKRHLWNAHGQTPEQYREHWRLPPDHPIVAPSYSAKRSQLAKDNGLGRKQEA